MASPRSQVFTPTSVSTPLGFSVQSRAQPQMTEASLQALLGSVPLPCCCFWDHWGASSPWGLPNHAPQPSDLHPHISNPCPHSAPCQECSMQLLTGTSPQASPESCLLPSTKSFVLQGPSLAPSPQKVPHCNALISLPLQTSHVSPIGTKLLSHPPCRLGSTLLPRLFPRNRA